MAREIPHLRTAYGVYLTNCQKEKVEKPITWRTFYMQCRGLRTLKPNTIQALSDYIRLIDEQHSKGYVSRCIYRITYKKMKTYSTNKYLQRLANFLVAYAVPFSYDGFTIEFTASQRLVDEMQNLDKVLAKIDFVVK